MKKLFVVSAVFSLIMIFSGIAGTKVYAGEAQGITSTVFPSAAASTVTVPGAVNVSPETGGRSIKNRWSVNADFAYSSYNINPDATGALTNQTGSIGFVGVAARYGLTEDLMLTAEFDYLYGLSSASLSGTTVENSYSGFPVSLNLLLFVPMNSFGIYAGVGPVYLASLSLKEKINGVQGSSTGFGAGGQGMIGIETYLSSYSSLGFELRYRHLNLYQKYGKAIAPLDSLSVGLNLIFYL